MSDRPPADRPTAPASTAPPTATAPAPSTDAAEARSTAPAPSETSSAAPPGVRVHAPHPEQARLVVRGFVFTVAMIAVGFAGTTARAGIETGLLVHLLRSVIVACALGTTAGLLALPALAARPGWRPWVRPVLVATCVPALVLGLALLLARATA